MAQIERKNSKQAASQCLESDLNLVRNYKERVGLFIREVCKVTANIQTVCDKHPPQVNDSYNDDAEKEHKKWIQPRGFRYASTQRDRIKEAAYKNQYLDTEPTGICFGKTPEQLMGLRKRDPSKELAGEFRTKHRNE